jgi:hypothetical protein
MLPGQRSNLMALTDISVYVTTLIRYKQHGYIYEVDFPRGIKKKLPYETKRASQSMEDCMNWPGSETPSLRALTTTCGSKVRTCSSSPRSVIRSCRESTNSVRNTRTSR